DLFAAHMGIERAADPAIGAGRLDDMLGRSDLDDAVFDQGRSRADLHTGPATDTIRRQETVGPHPGRDAAVKAPPLDGQRKSTLHLFAGPDATRTDDAFRRVEGEIGVRLILGPVFGVRPL